MINKKVSSVQEALQGIEDNMTLMLGGFGLCGIPENAIAELVLKQTISSKQTINVNNLKSGIYLINIRNNTQNITKKLLISE